jgi:hypothetical protein
MAVVRASHMRIGWRNILPSDPITAAVPGLQPKRASMANLQKIEELSLGKSDTVVMDLLSTVPFKRTSDDERPTPAIMPENGRYHITGSLTVVRPTLVPRLRAWASLDSTWLAQHRGTFLVDGGTRRI